jgi:hypothetical protein
MLYRVFPGGFETFMRETYRRRLPHIKGEYQWSHPSGEFPLPETYKFMDMFYRDIGLSPMISSDFFMISQVDDVSQLYQDIAQYRIIFLTTSCGTTDELFDFSEYMDPFRDNQDYIVICSNKNYYDAVDPRYDIAQRYIMLPTIFHYVVHERFLYFLSCCSAYSTRAHYDERHSYPESCNWKRNRFKSSL